MNLVLPVKYLINELHIPMSTAEGKIQIAIVEDIKDIAYDLQDLFNEQSDMQCSKVYHNAEEAISFLSRSPVDVVLCDIGLPGIDGIKAISTLYDTCENTQFCMFTVFEDNDKIFRSIKAGAKGYILKNSDPTRIVESIRELHKGGSPMNPEIARKIIDSFSAPRFESEDLTKDHPLTKREFQIVGCLADGLLYKEIAEHLGITLGTVKQHIHKIYDKLQVNNKTEAINKMRRN